MLYKTLGLSSMQRWAVAPVNMNGYEYLSVSKDTPWQKLPVYHRQLISVQYVAIEVFFFDWKLGWIADKGWHQIFPNSFYVNEAEF